MNRALLIIGILIVSPVSFLNAHPSKSSARALSVSGVVRQLRSSGLSASSAGTIEQSFFTPKARVYRVEGDDMQVYEYKSIAAAAKEAARVAPDGSIGGSMPMWIAPPHFFHKDRVIALYLGSNPKVLGELIKTLGPQFAGRP